MRGVAALVAAITAVACGPTAEHLPHDALTDRDQRATVTAGHRIWVMSGDAGRAMPIEWILDPQPHLTVVTTHFFATDPCEDGESGCPGGFDGFLISFDVPGEYDIPVYELVGTDCLDRVCTIADAVDTYTYHITVT